MPQLVPTIFEEEQGVKIYYDLYSRLLKDRIVFLTGPITDDSVNLLIAQLVYLERQNPKEDIQLYIQSPGGSVGAGFALYDTISYIKPDVVTIGIGMVASFASIILMSGAKGKRFILPHTRVMIHQPWVSGISKVTVTDLDIETQELKRNKEALIKIISKHTGQPISKVRKDQERDFWLGAKEAVKYGIVDKILK